MALTVEQGGTVHLSALFKNSGGALVDPTTPTVDIINPSNVTVASGLVPVRDSLGDYHYDYTVSNVAPLGDWIGRWKGTVSAQLISSDQTFTVDEPLADHIITLAEYKSLLGILTTNTTKDVQIEALLGAASTAVRNYAGRSFVVTTGATSARNYLYDGSGILDIDDCVAVTGITSDDGVTGQSFALDAQSWQAMPDAGPVFYYLLLYQWFQGSSPEMGFMQNLDVYYSERRYFRVPTLTVTAQWGWNSIPEDVKLATAFTIQDFVESPSGGEGLTSEAIESYSRSWAGPNTFAGVLGVPNRARDLLAPYTRLF